MNRTRVGVFMGGLSIEREVSLNSGRTICDHLDTTLYDVIPLFQALNRQLFILPAHFLHRGKTSDFEHRLATEAENISWDALKTRIDFMYIAAHGRYAEDGSIQGFLEVLGIPYLGSKVFASALGMNKIMQKEFLKAAGIAVPRGIAVHPYQMKNDITEIVHQLELQNISFPLVVKPYHEGSSFGVSIVHQEDQLLAALQKAMHVNAAKPQAVLIEEKIQGMEFSCISLMDSATDQWVPLPPTEVVAKSNLEYFDYEQKYMPGAATEFTPARRSADDLALIQQECVRASHVLGMQTISRIDGFLRNDGTVIIVDPNTLSGMAPTSFLFRESAHIQLSHTQVINHLIETELINYGLIQKKDVHKETTTMQQPKIRIAVLMGGSSNEREISLESGRNITYKLSPAKYEPIPIFVSSVMELFRLDQTLLVRNSTHEIEQLLSPDKKIGWSDLPKSCDFVFIGLHGGHGENGNVQGTLEMLGLPYNGSGILASALCMDKYKTNMFLKSQSFEIPASFLAIKKDWLSDAQQCIQKCIKIGLPLIVKPHDDGCSVMVQKVRTEEQLITAIETIFKEKEYALIEECITGMELTVGVIGNHIPRALPPSQAVSASDILSIEEKFLPGAGENQTPAPLPSSALTFVQSTIQSVYKTVDCKGYARVDCIYQDGKQSPTCKERLVILEINTLPGMTPATCIFHQAAELGIKPMDFIDQIITLGLEEHASGAKIKEFTPNQLVEKSKEFTT